MLAEPTFFITYIRTFSIGDLIYRRDLINFGRRGSQTIDNYRNYLTRAGYLKTKISGVYEYMKEIPLYMTYAQLVNEAYPYSEWVKKHTYIPRTFDEAIQILLNVNRYNKSIPADEKEFLCLSHHTVGQTLRNRWGLWAGSELCLWFNKQGIHHPDDMSSIILTSFHRMLNKKPIELEEQIQKHINYWNKARK
jgi:hypothetical protein